MEGVHGNRMNTTTHSPKSNKRILIIGLDCAEPSLIFDKYHAEMPNLKRLAQAGCGDN